jgi:hypothetical protein
VADVDPDSPNYLNIIGSISTAIPACDDGTPTGHYCGRADELGYDPKDHIILIANNAPLSIAAPHGATTPYATFISADLPFAVLGHVTFPAAWNNRYGIAKSTDSGSPCRDPQAGAR